MKLSKKLKTIIGTILFLSLLTICVLRASDILQRKASDFKYMPFFEQKEDFDVLFMGTSHVINGVFPMELWNDYGIVSYNFGGHGNSIGTSYWVMENALDYTSPKLMVIDVLFVGNNEKVLANAGYIHLSLNCFPLTWKKANGILDLCDDKNTVDKNGESYYQHRFEYIFDFLKYHSRWKELNRNEFTNENKSKEKGAESRIAVANPNKYDLIPKTETLKKDTTGIQYLEKMIEDCKQKNIEVLLVYLPYPAGKDAQIAANSVYAIAEEYGVNYINFVAMDNVVNYNTDCFDGGSHLNPSGARKVSDYLGKYIKEHYDIPDRRNDENYKSWFNDYENYLSYKTANINNQKIIENVLMLLSDKDFSACVYFKKNSQILKRKNISPLLENMAGQKLAQLEQAVKTNSGYCLVVDGDKKIICESAGEDFQDLETSFGNVSFFTKDGITNLQLQDKTNKLNGDWYKPESKVSEPDAQIFVINNRTKKIVSTSRWDFARQENVSKRK